MTDDPPSLSRSELLDRRNEHGKQLAVTLGAIVKELRLEREWTEDELGARLGLGQTGVSSWERGSPGKLGMIGLHNIAAIEDVFDLPKGALLRRLGAVVDEIDFETFVMSRSELTRQERYIMRDLHRNFTAKN